MRGWINDPETLRWKTGPSTEMGCAEIIVSSHYVVSAFLYCAFCQMRAGNMRAY